MNQSDNLTGKFVTQSLEHLQNYYFLPPVFSNTTFGAFAVYDSIHSGGSEILQQILRLPSVKPIVLESVQSSFISDEQISKMEVKENTEFQYLEEYNQVKSSNATATIRSLLRSELLRLQLLHPIFCPSGWMELVPSLFIAPHNIVREAYLVMEEEMGSTAVINDLIESQQEMIKPRDRFLRKYYARQLESEYLVLKAIGKEYKSFLTDSFSVGDWLQGLIQVTAIHGLSCSWEVCRRISVCMRKCWCEKQWRTRKRQQRKNSKSSTHSL